MNTRQVNHVLFVLGGITFAALWLACGVKPIGFEHIFFVAFAHAFAATALPGAALLLSVRFGLRALLASSLYTMFFIPTLCASIYASSTARWLRMTIPAACIALFVLHPVGNHAWFYSAYWLIPVFVAYYAHTSLFAQTLGSTFVAHAVGSVFYLYTMPTTSVFFVQLIPLVFIERFMAAYSITLIALALQKVQRYVLQEKTASVASTAH